MLEFLQYLMKESIDYFLLRDKKKQPIMSISCQKNQIDVFLENRTRPVPRHWDDKNSKQCWTRCCRNIRFGTFGGPPPIEMYSQFGTGGCSKCLWWIAGWNRSYPKNLDRLILDRRYMKRESMDTEIFRRLNLSLESAKRICLFFWMENIII